MIDFIKHILTCHNPRGLIASPSSSVLEYACGMLETIIHRDKLPITSRRTPDRRWEYCFTEQNSYSKPIIIVGLIKPEWVQKHMQGCRYSGIFLIDVYHEYDAQSMKIFRMQLRMAELRPEQHFFKRIDDVI